MLWFPFSAPSISEDLPFSHVYWQRNLILDPSNQHLPDSLGKIVQVQSSLKSRHFLRGAAKLTEELSYINGCLLVKQMSSDFLVEGSKQLNHQWLLMINLGFKGSFLERSRKAAKERNSCRNMFIPPLSQKSKALSDETYQNLNIMCKTEGSGIY